MIWYLISNKEHRLWRSVTFEVFYPGGQNPWIPFHRLPFSEKLLFSYFLPVFVSRFFFDVLPPFEKYPIALQHTFTDIFGITQTVPSLRKLFTASLPYAVCHFELFWRSLWVRYSIFESYFPLYENLYSSSWYYSKNKYVRKCLWHISISMELYADSFGYIPHHLKKHKPFSWHFALMSCYYCGGQ